MTELRQPGPIEVKRLFAPDREALLDLLEKLEPEDWGRPTVCAGWDVRDVALHMLGVDLGNLAIRRDGVAYLEPDRGESFPSFINRINAEWVTAARRLTPGLIRELLTFTGPLIVECFGAIDPAVVDANVSWTSQKPVPRWLDLAREYMERWVHQQHIRDAAGRPGQDSAEFVAPVVAASVFAVPKALTGQSGGGIAIEVEGPGGGEWLVERAGDTWVLLQGRAKGADCRLRLAVSDWWRTVTLGKTPASALAAARVEGDRELAQAVLRSVAIIA